MFIKEEKKQPSHTATGRTTPCTLMHPLSTKSQQSHFKSTYSFFIPFSTLLISYCFFLFLLLVYICYTFSLSLFRQVLGFSEALLQSQFGILSTFILPKTKSCLKYLEAVSMSKWLCKFFSEKPFGTDFQITYYNFQRMCKRVLQGSNWVHQLWDK